MAEIKTFDSAGGTNNVDEEEGLCFNCHDSDGPASSDISSGFASTVTHPVNDGVQSANGDADLDDQLDLIATFETIEGHEAALLS